MTKVTPAPQHTSPAITPEILANSIRSTSKTSTNPVDALLTATHHAFPSTALSKGAEKLDLPPSHKAQAASLGLHISHAIENINTALTSGDVEKNHQALQQIMHNTPALKGQVEKLPMALRKPYMDALDALEDKAVKIFLAPMMKKDADYKGDGIQQRFKILNDDLRHAGMRHGHHHRELVTKIYNGMMATIDEPDTALGVLSMRLAYQGLQMDQTVQIGCDISGRQPAATPPCHFKVVDEIIDRGTGIVA